MVEIFGICVPSDELVYWIAGIIVLAIVLALSYVMYLRAQMRTAKIATRATDYVKQNSFELKGRSDLFLYSNVTKIRINNDSKN